MKKRDTIGVLTHRAEDYLRCLDLGNRKLDDLLLADSKFWVENLEVTKSKAKQLVTHMSSLLERQFSELSEFLDKGSLRPKFDLRKLPLWGKQVDLT